MATARHEHRFQFKATEIAAAAIREAQYHRERELWWRRELELSTDRVRATAGVKIEVEQVTGGARPVVVVNYGDTAAYRRMQEAWIKAEEHRVSADRFVTDSRIYGTQGERVYDLDTEDVHYFRLGGEARPE